jgi:hypothetical protein
MRKICRYAAYLEHRKMGYAKLDLRERRASETIIRAIFRGLVCAFIDALIPKFMVRVAGLRKVHYWTDSPTSQYRNNHIFGMLKSHKETYGWKL